MYYYWSVLCSYSHNDSVTKDLQSSLLKILLIILIYKKIDFDIQIYDKHERGTNNKMGIVNIFNNSKRF